MGKVIGSPSQSATGGEWKFFRRMREILRRLGDFTCYYEPWLGDLHPDFLLLGSRRGVVVVEVKDYNVASVSEVTTTGPWRGQAAGREVELPNPFASNKL